ncbi:MAG TPA: glyoxalase [Glutamicibacter sp.]|nr:glyoxalase [Glutamicibacter sp.]
MLPSKSSRRVAQLDLSSAGGPVKLGIRQERPLGRPSRLDFDLKAYRLDSAVTSTGIVIFMTEKNGPDIDRSIYPMPMFINLVVSDLTAGEAFYASAGFVTLATIPGPGGVPSLVHLRREKYQDILMTQGTAARGTVSASFAAGQIDLDEVADSIRGAGGNVTGPIDTPWFTTDVTFSDPDGNTVTLTAPRMVDQTAAQAWVNDQITGDFEAPESVVPNPSEN